MSVIVTGSHGFIGGEVVQALAAAGEKVIAIDIAETAYARRELPCVFVNGDASEWNAWHVALRSSLLGTEDVSAIVHLASPVGAAGVTRLRGEIVRRVTALTSRVIEVAVSIGAKVVNVSSSEVFGGMHDAVGGLTEDVGAYIHSGYTARREYAVAKLAGEFQIAGAADARRIRAVSVRPFNVAGARQDPVLGFVLPRMAWQAVSGGPVTVFGDGSQIRAFTAVEDVATALATMAMTEGKAEWRGETYVVGNAENVTTLLDFARLVVEVAGTGAPIEMVDGSQEFGDLWREADGGSKYPAELRDTRTGLAWPSWKPSMSLRSIVEAAVEAERRRVSSTR